MNIVRFCQRTAKLCNILILFCLLAVNSGGVPLAVTSPISKGKGPKDPTLLAAAVEPPAETISNAYVQTSISQSGLFVTGTTGGDPATHEDDYKRLIYGYPSSIWTTYPTLRVSNGSTTIDYLLGYTETPITYPSNDGTTLLIVWNEDGVHVEQRLYFALNSATGRMDTTAIEYTLRNNNTSNHSVGLRMMLDVMVGSNDGAPYFILGNGQVTQQYEWTGANVPDFWIAYESPTFDTNSLKGRGQLAGGNTIRPDRFVIADWSQAYGTDWDYTVNPYDSITNDSAVLLYYNPTLLNPGQTRTYRTYYGIAGTVQTSQIELTGLEVTQAIQNLRNDFVLIEDRPTYVRAHVRSTIGTINDATATLVGRRVDGSAVFRLKPSNIDGHIDVVENPHRSNLADSFYFKVDPSWASGTVEFELQMEGYNLICHELDNYSDPQNNNDCKVQVTFSESPLLELNFVDFVWMEPDTHTTHTPSKEDHEMIKKEIESTLPIPYVKQSQKSRHPILLYKFTGIDPSPAIISHLGPPNTVDDHTRINLELAKIQLFDICPNMWPLYVCKQFYLGTLVDPPSSGILGGATRSTPPDLLNTNTYYNSASAFYLSSHEFLIPSHELGHALGRCHTYNAANLTTPSDICSHDPIDGAISSDKGEDSPSAFYGFDFNAVEFYNPPLSNKPYTVGPIYGPNTPDLMSYAKRQWPSAFTYRFIHDHLVSRFGTSSLSANFSDGGPVAVISGIVNPAEGSGSLDPVFIPEPPITAITPNSGSYTLKFENNLGQELAAYNFEPDYANSLSIESIEDNQSNLGFFVLCLPWDTATTHIVLLHNSQVLDSRTASINTPTIQVVYPNGGESLSGPTATLSWTAGDIDGDNLSYIVQYSTDTGATWQTLVTDWPFSEYEIDLERITGTDQGLFRVLVSDGFHTAVDQSDAPFKIANHAPWVSINAPQTESLFVGDQTIIFEGYAIDNEEGQLGDSTLTWSSDLDGNLGSGQSLAIVASALTEGTHTITLTALDSNGQTGSAQVIINVYREDQILPIILSSAPSTLNFFAYQDGGQTASQIISVRNIGDGSMLWSATADHSWILLSSLGGVAPTDFIVVANPVGLPVGEYTGNITITAYGANNSPQTIPVMLLIQDTPPVVNNITRANANPTSAESVNFTVTFSEPVSGVDMGDFKLIATPGIMGGYIVDPIIGSGTTYTVTVDTGSGNGTLRFDVVDDDSIVGGSNNPLGGVGSGNGDFTSGEVYDVIKQFTISGNAGAAGVTLIYIVDGITQSAKSDRNGNYSLMVPLGWSGTVTPALQCGGLHSIVRCYFYPGKRVYTNVQTNLTRENYKLRRIY